MNYLKQKIIEYLLNNADPSIVLRVKKEIVNGLSKMEEKELLSKIITQKNIQTIIKAQKPDGWIGNHFHGQSEMFCAGMYDNMEVGLRFLAEKGFPPENEYVTKAVNSFLLKGPFDSDVYRMKILPDMDYSYTAWGLYLLRSSIIIRAGYENQFPPNNFIDLKHDIDFSFENFANVLNYSNQADVIETRGKKLCFKPGIMWPCMYHLRILAHSKGWRENKNISLLADSVNHLFLFPHPDNMVYTYIKGQYRGPCFAFLGLQFLSIISSINDKTVGNMWFDLMELFARCGIVNKVEVLKNEYESMLTMIDDNLNFKFNFSKKQKEKEWSPYFGIALEEDWKTKIRKQCDLLFRILLIIHHVR
jgi:hypothetical protein